MREKGGKTNAFSWFGTCWEHTLTPDEPAHGNGEKNRKGRPEALHLTLSGNAMRSKLWGPNAASTVRQDDGERVQSKSDTVRERESAIFKADGTKCTTNEMLCSKENVNRSFIISEIAGDLEI